ncbi:MAG: class I SAM-dependent methyltransferase [Candidatus Kapabacteria bacterium]|nr:class I SAM-dependent methyltransferase [Candidatus Kapabacteria bacterium]
MIKIWILKAVVQKAISWLPWKHSVNFLMQRYISKSVQLSDEYFFDRLEQAVAHLRACADVRGRVPGRTFELGTGWYPVVPVAMYLSGAEHVTTVDISRLANRDRVLTTLRRFVEAHAAGRLSGLTVLPERMQRVERLLVQAPSSLEALLAELGISYVITDARHTSFDDGMFDFVHSNNVFEHIPADVLNGLLKEFERIRTDDGVMSHFIDMSDHFAHLDRTITIYNFLRYSERAWQLIDNDIQPQNRMRLPQYLDLYRQRGINVLRMSCRPGSIADVQRVPLAHPFSEMDVADVAVSHAYIVSA